jgi:hypothetical protein
MNGDEAGRTHIGCTAQVVTDNDLCFVAFGFDDDGSQDITEHRRPEGGDDRG